MKRNLLTIALFAGFAASYAVPQSDESQNGPQYSFPGENTINKISTKGLDLGEFKKQKSIILWTDVQKDAYCNIDENFWMGFDKCIYIFYSFSGSDGRRNYNRIKYNLLKQKASSSFLSSAIQSQWDQGSRIKLYVVEKGWSSFSINPPVYFLISKLNDSPFIRYQMIAYPDVQSLLSGFDLEKTKGIISFLIDKNIDPSICNSVPLIIAEKARRAQVLKTETENKYLASIKVFALRHYAGEIEQEKRTSGLFLPKDEFETDADYKKRQSAALEFSSSLDLKYCLLYKEYLTDEEAVKKEKIRQSYENITLAISAIGTYNTTNQSFPVTIDGKVVTLAVPLPEAKSFKENYLRAQVKADRQLAADGKKLVVFNIKVVHPVTGSVYTCGEQGSPLYLDVVSAKVSNSETGLPKLVAGVKFSDPSGNNLLDGGETGKFVVQIKNDGNGNASGIIINLSANPAAGLLFDKSKSLGGLLAGQQQNFEFPVTAGKDITNQEVEFQFSFSEQHGFKPAPVNYRISTQEFKAPKIVFKEAGIKEIFGNNNNIIENGENIEITALVQNIGQGTAVETQAVVSLGDPNIITMTPGLLNQKLGTLAPNETRLITFQLAVNNEYSGSDKLPVTLILSEKYKTYGGSYPLNLEMKKVQLSAANITLTGKYTASIPITDQSLISSVEKNIPVAAVKNPNRIALIIGNEDYSSRQTGISSESNVPFALSDARSVREYMVKTLGFEANNTFLLLNATAGEMIQEIDRITRLSEKFGPDAEIMFYYAGHGYPDESSKEPYLVPVDISATNLSAGIKLADLYSKLASAGARRVTIFLDACFSGGGRAAGLLSNARGVKIKPKTGELEGNLVVFAATTGEQSALPLNQERHGLFTYFLLKKMQETSGNVSYGALSDYLKHNVSIESLRVNKKEQDPAILVSPAIQNDWEKMILR